MLNQPKNAEVLVLPSWYPNQLDTFAGDFVQRHVQAISAFHKQKVLFIVKDEEGQLTKNTLESRNHVANIEEIIVYYHVKKTGIKFLDRIFSDRKYIRLYKKHLKNHIAQNGYPALCHLHIAMKAGRAAVWLKKKFDVPYVLTEHWSGYLAEARPRISDLSLIFRQRTRNILLNAKVVTAVSLHLSEAIHNLYPGVQPIVIPNVVDTSIFYPEVKKNNCPIKFIHASTMTYPKNIEKIFEALQTLKSKSYQFEMHMFGPVHKAIPDLIEAMQLTSNIFLHGDVSQKVLAREMQQADALIQFSKFETFSCVVIEANAAGIPVFISDIPVLKELIKEGENGFVVKADDSNALAESLMRFADGNLKIEKINFSSHTEKFSYSTVGKRFSEVYLDIINEA